MDGIMASSTEDFRLDEYITLEEASTISGISTSALRTYARTGRLKAIKRGRDWFTTKRWIQEYLESRVWSKD